MQNNYNNTNTDSVPAGFFVRFFAYLLDLMIVGTFLLFVRLFVWLFSMALGLEGSRQIVFNFTFLDIFLYLCQVAYFILLTYFTGTTLGKRAMQLTVISPEGEKPAFFTVLYRETVGRFLSSVILSVGYFMIGIDKEKRGLHDILADTRVVYLNRVRMVAPPMQGNIYTGPPRQVTPSPLPANQVFSQPNSQPQAPQADTTANLYRVPPTYPTPKEYVDPNQNNEPPKNPLGER